MNESPEEQKLATSSRLVASTIQSVIGTTSTELTRVYEQLKWLGFSAVVGALMIVASFIFTVIPRIDLPLKSQILFVLTGFGVLLLSAALYALQLVHAFRLEDRNRDINLRSIELKYDMDKAIALKSAEKANGKYTAPQG